MKGKLIANNNLLLPLSAGHSAVIIRRLSSNYYHQTIVIKLLSSNYYHQTVVIKLLSSNCCHQTVVIKLLSSNYCHQTIISRETQLGGYSFSATLNAIFPAEPDANYPTSG
ncbi:hypothetical protein [Moellerella wisconsensis]|uniref:Uncharacterized protein n=1 Tax=Moellerella wisconsensis TaxID=158849 RepID=A0A9Q8V386_9GAMM|nr:hypothetical protein [Moellerella wisconsensis]UNH29972.1 hypothetical protein MNY72_11485 [Moellerella wisconsensis]